MEPKKQEKTSHHKLYPRPLVLIGLMGVGKTSIGRRLANRLGLAFFDADHEIEATAGCSVAEFFDRHGESAFRDSERRHIAHLLANRDMVLATGGGAFIDPQTRALVKEQATSIWLKADLDLLVERTSRHETRPLLLTGDARTVLRQLMVERDPIYAEADVIVTVADESHEQTVERVLRALNSYVKDLEQ